MRSPAWMPPARLPVAFGNQVTGNVYFPASRAAAAAPPLPAVVWLHPFSYSSGPAPVYNGKEDMYRASAIRALCTITDATMLQAIERYMKQAIVDRFE